MKTALVTGGAQGIGRGIVQRLRRDRWHVALFDMDEDALDEMRGDDPALLCLPVDMGQERSVLRGFEALSAWLNGRGLDLLVSNAGIADSVSGPIEDLSLSDWRRWQDSHVTGAFLAVRGAVPLLRVGQGSGGQGGIVLMSSTRALQSEPQTEAYAAAKGALTALTHALAVSLGPRIRVNCILPGWIETGPWQKSAERHDPDHTERDRLQHPVGRVGRPEDVAGLVAWLASDEAGFITGQRFVVDGGMSVRMIYED